MIPWNEELNFFEVDSLKLQDPTVTSLNLHTFIF
jgi:hypothetical protein